MALAELSPGETPVRRSIAQVRAAGREAVELLAEAERIRARAVAQLVEFDAIDAHVAEGFLTPQRHLIHRGGVIESEAGRLHRIVRFCANHPEISEALEMGRIGVDHAELLRVTAQHVDGGEFAADCTGSFNFDAAASVILAAALDTEPDPVTTLEPARTLKQRRADRLIELCGAGLDVDAAFSEADPSGARQTVRPAVDVVIDLPTLLGVDLDLDDHRDQHGDVDWDSIRAALALTGSTPRPVLEQFFCDASWRSLITSGSSVVLNYTEATADIAPALRRVIQRRDRHCQFDGCDRHWSWCDVHHLVPRGQGGPTTERNLALVCRRHHTMIHQAGWQLSRRPGGRLVTTSP